MLLTILLIIALVAVALIAIAVLGIGGSVIGLVFGDGIIFVAIIVLIVRKIIKKRKRP